GECVWWGGGGVGRGGRGGGAGERGGRAFEHAQRFGVVAGCVGVPAVLPGGALGVRARREPLVQLLERLGREVVLVREDVVRAEVVERLARPAAVRERVDQRTRQPRALVDVAQAANRAEGAEL